MDILQKLEQELVFLAYLDNETPPLQKEKRIKEIKEEMQSLYRDLGGIFVTDFNLNYDPDWKPKDHQ